MDSIKVGNLIQLFDFHLKHKGNKFISTLREPKEPLLSWCPGLLLHLDPGALLALWGQGATLEVGA